MLTFLCKILGHDTGGCCTENLATGECTAFCSRCGKELKGGLRDFIPTNIEAHERLSESLGGIAYYPEPTEQATGGN